MEAMDEMMNGIGCPDHLPFGKKDPIVGSGISRGIGIQMNGSL